METAGDEWLLLINLFGQDANHVATCDSLTQAARRVRKLEDYRATSGSSRLSSIAFTVTTQKRSAIFAIAANVAFISSSGPRHDND